MTNSFDSKSLAEKLNKLNNSQQGIESLSSWCIAHRDKAKQVIETWEKVFNNPSKDSKEIKVSMLYLANDILQNGRRHGCEFVNEFWKVLPGALKKLYVNGEDKEKSVIIRLVEIWDERKVFGSRGRGLKNVILCNETQPPSSLVNNGKNSNASPIKVVQKDSQTIRIKLAVGGMPEKIVTAFQTVLDEHFDEDTALNKCQTAIHVVEKISEDIDGAGAHGNMQESTLTNELQAQETILKQCIDQLRSVEANRASLVTYLKEGLQEQESKLEQIRNQLLAVQTETDHITNLKHKMASAASLATPNLNPEASKASEAMQPVTYFAKDDEQSTKKAAVAAMAAKLTASSSSAEMLSSLLSSLVAEEAASKNGSLASSSPIQKRQKLDNPASVHDPNSNPMPVTYFSPFRPPMPMPASQYIQTSAAMPFMFPGNSMPVPPGTMQVPLPPPPPVLPPQQQPESLGSGYYPISANGFYGQQPQQQQQQLQSVPPASRQ